MSLRRILGHRLLILHVTSEPTPGDLCDGGDIIGAAVSRGLPNAVVAVVGPAREPVLENHQRCHHVGALDMTDVDALDA
ncbi:Uncharacterised protein [Mycobacteroides abscessus subsp. abscessus]|nr:Uncharacterised protein [Mycobacteroides abscessus subsp. abscessus]